LNGLISGFLGAVVLCRSGVRAKFGVNMGSHNVLDCGRPSKHAAG